MRLKTHSVSSISCHLLPKLVHVKLYVNLVLLVLFIVLSDSSCSSDDKFERVRPQDWWSSYKSQYQISRYWPPQKAWTYRARQKFSKLKNQPIKSRNVDHFNPCETPKRFSKQIEERIAATLPNNKNYQKLHNHHRRWSLLYQNCVFKKRLNENYVVHRRQGEMPSPFQPPAIMGDALTEINTKGLLVVTGIGSLLTTYFLWFLFAARTPKQVPKTRRITQQLHIHSVSGEHGESHKEKESEESDLKKAAVGIGLATEIVAINAESIHLAAHIIEFLHILSKIARALPRPAPPATRDDGVTPPPPPPPGQLFTPQQALEFLQFIEKNYSSSKIFSGIKNSGFKNPLGFLGGGNISASTVFKNAINNPAASIALKKLLAPFNSKGNRTTVSSGNSPSVNLKPLPLVSHLEVGSSTLNKIKPINDHTETLLKPEANANPVFKITREAEKNLCIIFPTTCHVILGTKKL